LHQPTLFLFYSRLIANILEKQFAKYSKPLLTKLVFGAVELVLVFAVVEEEKGICQFRNY